MLRNRLLVFLGCLVLLGILAGGVVFKLARIQNRAHENLERLEEITHYATTAQGLAMGGFARAFDVVTSTGTSSGLEAEYLSLHGRIEDVFRAWEFVLEELEAQQDGAKGKLRNYYKQVRREYRRLSGVFYQIIALKEHGQTAEALQVLKREHSEVLVQRFAENAEELRLLHEEQDRELVRGIHQISMFTYATLGLFILLVTVVAVLFTRRLIGSLNVMRRAVSLVSTGSLTERLSVDSKDEFGLLAQAFNTMTEEIGRSHGGLVASEAYIHDIITSMVDSLFVVDGSGKLQTVNKATAELLGYTEQELIGQQVGMFLEEQELELVSLSKAGRLEELMQLGSVRDYSMVYATKSGEKIPVNLWTSSMRDGEGRAIGIVGIARDMREMNRLRKREKALVAAEVTAEAERKRAGELGRFNERMRQANEQLKGEITERKRVEEQIANLAKFPNENPNPVLRISNDGTILYANAASAPLLNLWGCRIGECLSSDPRQTTLDVFDSGSGRNIEVRCRDRIYSLMFEPIRGAQYVNIYGLDITERKQAEDRIGASLKEKEVLLKEVHHRVKNNLQLISSLLNLEAGSGERDPQKMFQDSQHRVRAMAFIHEGLYQSKDLARVEFGEYVRTLTAHLMQSYGANGHAVTLKTDVEAVALGVDLAIPCGLILNELVSNALKHAFPNGRTGEIRVALHVDRARRMVLQVSDTGVGVPPEVDIRQAATLGLQLVTTLTEQVEGTLELTREGGTTFTLTCPLEADGSGRG